MSTPVRIFVGGGQAFHGPTAERDAVITEQLAELLHRGAPGVQIITGGMPGIPEVVANAWARLGGDCLDVVSQEYHQEYVERNTGRAVMIAGMDQAHRRHRVSELEGIACAVFIQGGTFSTHEITLFLKKGVPVVTLYGSGGAAGGQIPYGGWSYTPPEYVLASIVSSTDPNENAAQMARALADIILMKLSTPPKRLKLSQDRPVPVAFAIDIESRGDDLLKHGILSIGYCVGRLDREEVIERGRISLNPLKYLAYDHTRDLADTVRAYVDWCMKYSTDAQGEPDLPEPPPHLAVTVNTQQFEERCLREFWLNDEKCPGGKAKMETLVAEGVDAIDGIRQFRQLLDRYDDGVEFTAKVLSDNIVFDGGWLDYYLSLANCRRLQHDASGRYRRVYDTVDYRRGACHMDYGERWMNEKEIIAHFGLSVNTDDHTHMPDADAEYIYRFHQQLVDRLGKLPLGRVSV